MNSVLVSGLINIEITLKVDEFPIHYTPVRYPFYGVNSTVSGVGYNVAAALTALGDKVDFLSLIGRDCTGKMVKDVMDEEGIPRRYIVEGIPRTPHSVIIYENSGRRMINLDLKDIQETPYPEDLFDEAVRKCDLAVLCNINFSRPMLKKAGSMGKIIASDVHAICNLDDDYNRDYMEAAHILFMSNELLPCSPEDWIRQVMNRFGTEIAVVGLGGQGALLGVRQDNFLERFPAVATRPVVNTIGAGDALFSAFIHFYRQDKNPYEALEKAMVFASYKIGEAGAAEGFLDEKSLLDWCARVKA